MDGRITAYRTVDRFMVLARPRGDCFESIVTISAGVSGRKTGTLGFQTPASRLQASVASTV
jgi:hypothetical protein